MAIPEASQRRALGSGVSRCQDCGAALADDQRYCVECGQRRGPLPLAMAGLLGLAPGNGGARPDAPGGGGGVSADGSASSRPAGPLGDLSPAVAGVAVIALLAFGVLLGSAVSPVGPVARVAPIVVAVSPSTKSPASAPVSAPIAPPTTTPAPAEAAPAEGAGGVTTIVERIPATQSAPTNPPSSPATGATPLSLPPITHLFLIV